MNYPASLIDFEYPSGTNHRRFLLSLGKPNSFLSVDVHAGESFTVVVIDRDLPVAMLAAFVVTEAGSPAHRSFVLSLFLLFHRIVRKNSASLPTAAFNRATARGAGSSGTSNPQPTIQYQSEIQRSEIALRTGQDLKVRDRVQFPQSMGLHPLLTPNRG